MPFFTCLNTLSFSGCKMQKPAKVLARVVVQALLLWYGTLYLVYTETVQDLAGRMFPECH